MKKSLLIFILITLTVVFALSNSASSMPIYFSDSALVEGKVGTSYEDLIGTAIGSAILNYSFDVTGKELTILIDNTSPLTDDDGNSNSPSITSFGFDVANEPGAGSFSVEAFGFFGGAGSNPLVDITNLWQLDTDVTLQGSQGSLKFDFVPNTINGGNGGVINPNADGSTGNDLFETTATFLIIFDDDPGLLSNWHMRFQNLGVGGEGSLNKVPGSPVPEPSTMVISSLFLLGAGLYVRRKLHS